MGCLLLCRFSDAGMTRAIHALRRPASEKRQCTKSREYGTRQCSECYGDRMFVHARMQMSPGECNGHLGGHTEFINGRLVN